MTTAELKKLLEDRIERIAKREPDELKRQFLHSVVINYIDLFLPCLEALEYSAQYSCRMISPKTLKCPGCISCKSRQALSDLEAKLRGVNL